MCMLIKTEVWDLTFFCLNTFYWNGFSFRNLNNKDKFKIWLLEITAYTLNQIVFNLSKILVHGKFVNNTTL